MWWVGFKAITWIGEGGEPIWYETFPGKVKRGFCSTCVTQAERVSRHVCLTDGVMPGAWRPKAAGP